MASFRQAFRNLNTPLRSAFRPSAFRQTFRQQTRKQTTAAAEDASAEQSKIGAFWNSHVGPKTVHFWAPIAKWGVVLSGASDFARPAESLSLQQNMALMLTGSIWTRWCFIIKPRNLFLAAVNFFLFTVGAVQTTRVLMYRQSLKHDSAGQEAKDVAKETKDQLEGVAKHPEQAAKKATNV